MGMVCCKALEKKILVFFGILFNDLHKSTQSLQDMPKVTDVMDPRGKHISLLSVHHHLLPDSCPFPPLSAKPGDWRQKPLLKNEHELFFPLFCSNNPVCCLRQIIIHVEPARAAPGEESQIDLTSNPVCTSC